MNIHAPALPTTSTGEIVVEDTFAHAPAVVWKALTTGALVARWLMVPTGYEAAVGKDFTFQTKAAGGWDGVIHCKVLEVVENERLAYSWKGGDASNVGYGAPLDTLVTFTLTPSGSGTTLRLVHSGFVTPKNDSALQTMGEGWKKVVPSIGALAGEVH